MLVTNKKIKAALPLHSELHTLPAHHLASWFKHASEQPALVKQLKKIKLVVADIDGSLTDGTVEYTENTEGTRWFSTQDGFATRKAAEHSLSIAFLSGKGAGSGQFRAKMLGIPHDLCILGVSDKRPAVTGLQRSRGLHGEETLVFGDDYLDAEVKLNDPKVFFVAPANAPFYIQHAADLTLPLPGGQHAFRLLVDLVLYVRGEHFAQEMIKAAL